MIHDIEYKKAKDNYLKNPTPENRKKQLNNVWKADDKFINEMERDHDEPMAPIAGKLIKTKKSRKTGALSTKTFEGFGKDPAHKLRMEALKTSKKNEKQKGGFVIAPWLAALLLSAGVKVTERVVDFIADKMQGKGMKRPKTVAERKKLLSYLLKK